MREKGIARDVVLVGDKLRDVMVQEGSRQARERIGGGLI